MRKRSKGGAWCRSLSAALASLLFFAVAAPASAAELYGLVVGIDDYVGEGNDLDGAANDAADVAQSLTRAGAKEVVRLVNAEATKERIFAAWEDLTAKAQPGDTIVFTYAGHGSQEPEPKGVMTRRTGSMRISCSGNSCRSDPAPRSAFSTMKCSNGCRRQTRRG